jgi:hypothetical protein
MQQEIAVSGQQFTAYNYYGHKNTLIDYIPSVYLRVQKGRWFLQTEFRYAAPQATDRFSFSKRSGLDSNSTHFSSTTLQLQKTYYHQLPVSINYELLPHWSVGLGAMFSRFRGAVYQEQVSTTSLQTGNTDYRERILNVRNFNDSFLYKTKLHALLQTDYQWKRLSFGLRYARDLQPYIRFTQPSGTISEKRNYSLMVNAKWRLF